MYTDTERLNWLIRTGNYGYVDTTLWPGSESDVRERIDKAMDKDASQHATASDGERPCCFNRSFLRFRCYFG